MHRTAPSQREAWTVGTRHICAGTAAQSWNFFAFNLSNHLPPSEGIAGVLAKKFEQASSGRLSVKPQPWPIYI
jgi:hypothetical protein